MSKPTLQKAGKVQTSSFESMLKPVRSQAVEGMSLRDPKRRRTAAAITRWREEIRAEAEAEGRKTGFEQGRSEGLEEGRRLAYDVAFEQASAARKEELVQFVAALQGVVAKAEDAMRAWYVAAERELDPIVVEIARRIVLTELKSEPETIRRFVSEAMAEATHANHVRLRANPADSEIVRSFQDEIVAAAQGLKGIEIVDDPAIVGGCIIETESGVIDASVEGKLLALSDELRRAA
ncbi:MAG: F0F1 ATP synthase subunit delta [Fimbriimonas ginsengisoli]|uniref:F0F1 ATP synthase subunit delta n=1 Tax=Fimbriimonas ginsengisoli TaxID=1005039 RepID=A0A931PUV7_FIMGI|nr:F0F1 ATP synthase subunit delta [Fimbriimonas ginsengisoli]